MADTTFKVGDVVVLKSGGPPMTVQKLNGQKATGPGWICCTWFEGEKRVADDFIAGTLEKDEDDPEPGGA